MINKRKNDFLGGNIQLWVWLLALILVVSTITLGVILGQQMARHNIYMFAPQSPLSQPLLPAANVRYELDSMPSLNAALTAENAALAAANAQAAAENAERVAANAAAVASQSALAASRRMPATNS